MITAAGQAILKLALNLSFISQPCVLVAAIVVSDIKDRLSPNMAPPTIEPRIRGIFRSAAPAAARATGTSTEIVPQEVPIAMERIQEIRKKPKTTCLPGIKLSSRYATLSDPPAAVATLLNAPASRKIMIITAIFSFPIPAAIIFNLSSKLYFRFCSSAIRIAMVKATTTGIT